MIKHSKFSASSSERWLRCTGSIFLIEKYKDEIKEKPSIFAEEGTLAHDIADKILRGVEHQECDETMLNYIMEYVNYIRRYLNNIEGAIGYSETKLHYDNVVTGGFGTCDYSIIAPEEIHVFDLKYGKNLKVEVKNNTQLQLYAIGVMNNISDQERSKIKNIIMHIVQPRIGNIVSWTITSDQLADFGYYAMTRAIEALEDTPKFTPSNEACLYCPAKPFCKASHNLIKHEILKGFVFDDIVSDSELKVVLDHKNLIKKYLEDVESLVYDRLNAGIKFNGYKLTVGHKTSKWTSDAERYLLFKLGQDAYQKKLITITEARRIIGNDVEEFVERIDTSPRLSKEN
ncbi:hypothetical protein AB832_06600 [Flavobacteriaceae bacterium (ex Bugula neritina AB1)]|nr:hypothetical protein AB832_06600 [Flavobacteriaceae bacterium (ex Bugula neritina AB1)]